MDKDKVADTHTDALLSLFSSPGGGLAFKQSAMSR